MFRSFAGSGCGAVATLALLGWGFVAAPLAAGSDTVTIPLAPAVIELSFTAQENVGTVPVAIPVPTGGPVHDVATRYGGTVTITVPPQELDTGHVGATLALERGDDPQSRTYSTDPNTPPDNHLSLAALGSNRYRIQLPADDGVNGPVARLLLVGLELRPGIGVIRMDPTSYRLRMSADGPASVELRQQAIAVGCPPDRDYSPGCGPVPPLSPGTHVRVTLPSDSRLRPLGLPGLQHSTFAIQPNESRWPARSTGTPLPAQVSADGGTAEMIVPDGITAGPHQFTAVVGDRSGQLVTIIGFRIDVVTARSSTPLGTAGGSPPPAGVPGTTVPSDSSNGPSAVPIVLAGSAAALLFVASASSLVLYHRRRMRRHHHPA